MDKKAINQARSLYYIFFAKMLDFAPNDEGYKDVETLLPIFLSNPLDEGSYEALGIIQEKIKTEGFSALRAEYDEVFVSPESSFIPLSASYYDEGRDDGQKRVKAADLVLRSKFRRNKPLCNDSEDQIVFAFRFMSMLIQAGLEGDEESLNLAHTFFVEILNECVDDFAELLFTHEKSVFYKNTAIVLKAFSDFERLYLDVAPSQKVASAHRVGAVIQTDRKPLTQRIRRNLDEIVL